MFLQPAQSLVTQKMLDGFNLVHFDFENIGQMFVETDRNCHPYSFYLHNHILTQKWQKKQKKNKEFRQYIKLRSHNRLQMMHQVNSFNQKDKIR